MPLLRLTLTEHPLQPPAQITLAERLTLLMRDLMGKRADLTVVQTETRPAVNWVCNGQSLKASQWCASLEVFITAGTNTASEVAAFIQAANHLICEYWTQPPGAPLYIVVQAVDGAAWGYDGETQAARRLVRA
jgi:4-oxalocrotonate tautomerase